jgi:hypothetical protein
LGKWLLTARSSVKSSSPKNQHMEVRISRRHLI